MEKRLGELNQLAGTLHRKATCELRSYPVYGRYLRQKPTGELEIDREKVKAEERLDGKYLLSTSDDLLSVEEVVLGYKQLFEVERVFRDLKHLVDIRPVYHRLPERIKAHVLLCFLAILLIRAAENERGLTWRKMKKELSTLQVAVHRTASGEVWQTNGLRSEVKSILEQLKIKPPPRFYALKPEV